MEIDRKGKIGGSAMRERKGRVFFVFWDWGGGAGGGEGGGEGGWGYVMVYSVYIYIQYLLIKAFSIITKIYKRKGDDPPPNLIISSLFTQPRREIRSLLCSPSTKRRYNKYVPLRLCFPLCCPASHGTPQGS